MNIVDVQNEQETIPLDADRISQWAHQILEILGGRLDLLVEWMVLARPAPAP